MNAKGTSFEPKLTEEQRIEVCRRLAQFETPTEIHTWMKGEGIAIRREDIYKYVYAKKWKPFIAAARQEWVKGMVDIPLVHKRSRIEELVKLIGRCERDRKLSDRAKRDEVASRLRQIQEEVDEKHTHFTTITANQYIGVSYEELLQRRDAWVERLKPYGGGHGGEVHRIGQGAVDEHPGPGGEGDGVDGGHHPGAEAGESPSHGGNPQLPG